MKSAAYERTGPERCAEDISGGYAGMPARRCVRRATHDGYCFQHHPDWPGGVSAPLVRTAATRIAELERIVAELAERAGIAVPDGWKP